MNSKTAFARIAVSFAIALVSGLAPSQQPRLFWRGVIQSRVGIDEQAIRNPTAMGLTSPMEQDK